MAAEQQQGDRFQHIVLEPGSPAAYSCFGTWENLPLCAPLLSKDELLAGCSQAVECRSYTLEKNPPTVRFLAKPRRDGRFEVQQFREFIGDHESYQLEIQEGRIVVTYPGSRKVPKSRRFFLHVKHVEQAQMDLSHELEIVTSLDNMLVRQAVGEVEEAEAQPAVSARSGNVDPGERRRRIAERLRKRAQEDAQVGEEDEELDIELDIDIDFIIGQRPPRF